MFLKLLLTALVIAGAVLTVRMRNRRMQLPMVAHPQQLPDSTQSRLWKLAAATVALLLLVAAGLYIYHQWRDTYQVVTLRVIDTRTGAAALYKAYKGDVDGRHFTTTDGRQVSLAEVERLEMGSE